MPRFTEVATETRRGIKIAQAVSVGIYLVSAIGLASILGGLVLQFAFQGPTARSLSVDSTNSVNLIWTAPGDDGAVGTATSYTIRYSTSQLSDANWETATAVSVPPTPLPSGTVQSTTVTGLAAGTTYYFGIKSKDEAGNESALSNVPSKRTDTVACTPQWSCTEFSVCRDGFQSRTCIDVAQPSCNGDYNKPIERQSCSAPPQDPATCVERWSCSDWTQCASGLRSRVCQDLNRCGTSVQQPVVSYDCSAGGPLPDNPSPTYLVAAQAKGGTSQVRVYSATGGKRLKSFSVYKSSFRNGLSLAGGDLDRTGTQNIVIGAGVGSGPQVSLYSMTGKLITRFFAYTKMLRTGVNVAVGDVDGDGNNELVTAPAGNYPGLVRIFRYDPSTKKFTRTTDFSSQTSKYRGGVNLAVTDLDRNGYSEIIVTPVAKGRNSSVEVYEYNVSTKKIVKRLSFSAYAKSFNGGIEVTTADVNGDGIPEIMVAPAPGASDVRVYAYVNRKARLLTKFMAAGSQFRGGVDLAAVDVNLDGSDDLITSTFSSGLPGLRVYKLNPATNKIARANSPFPANVFSASFLKGIRIAAF